ncbi:hypothetical protein NIBR502772_10955 [Pseudarthrobacter sp. NIBRBAC000502772]|uniref:hypothetical protein n=1 Tax=Pseudarthrobacter sp. NIBRBAC000502772 TaxID=2590775 RepID=UPI00112FF6C1|nr:hypothetical protein [Pseudarthrobacter sp. NIBRBAC000502772]QDG66659.1 hypothetical protein NIBR502772_10955 [Pseudarthrobacter sp. NIBRBAC000502772]
MAANPTRREPNEPPVQQDDEAFDADDSFYEYNGNSRKDAATDAAAGVILLAGVIGGQLIAPHVKPWLNNTVKPAAKKLRDKVTKRKPAEPTDFDAT